MSASANAVILLEQGTRVLAHQVLQDDLQRAWRVIRGLGLKSR